MKRSVAHVLCYTLALAALLAAGSALAANSPITLEQATNIAKAFVGAERAGELSYTGIVLRKGFPPLASCYRFKLPLHLSDEGKPLKAELLIDEKTGRVLQYDSGYSYEWAKWKGKEKPPENELISEAKAKEIVLRALAQAGIPSEGMRVAYTKSVRSNVANNYSITYSKWVQVQDVGDVEIPVVVLTQVDAATGELFNFIYKEWPVVAPLVPPKVSRDRAVELVKEKQYLKDVSAVGDVHLKVDFDLQGISKEEAELEDDDYPRFYAEVEMKRQVLAWEVSLKGTHPFMKEIVDLTALVDANTGDVFDYNMPM